MTTVHGQKNLWSMCWLVIAFSDSNVLFIHAWEPHSLREFWGRKTSHTPVASSASSAWQWSQVINGRSRLEPINSTVYHSGTARICAAKMKSQNWGISLLDEKEIFLGEVPSITCHSPTSNVQRYVLAKWRISIFSSIILVSVQF